MSEPCEAIIAQFTWGGMRCNKPSTGEAIDATWGTIHPVCDEHKPVDLAAEGSR